MCWQFGQRIWQTPKLISALGVSFLKSHHLCLLSSLLFTCEPIKSPFHPQGKIHVWLKNPHVFNMKIWLEKEEHRPEKKTSQLQVNHLQLCVTTVDKVINKDLNKDRTETTTPYTWTGQHCHKTSDQDTSKQKFYQSSAKLLKELLHISILKVHLTFPRIYTQKRQKRTWQPFAGTNLVDLRDLSFPQCNSNGSSVAHCWAWGPKLGNNIWQGSLLKVAS